MAGLGLGLAALLIAAAVLRPSPAGFGTHQQLGLPPCTFVMLFGNRCPSCGMTTSWAFLMRGQLVGSAQANCGGMLLGVLALLTAPWALVSAVRGRWLLGTPGTGAMVVLTGVIVAVTIAQWVWRMM